MPIKIRQESEPTLNLTAMIDVLFLLIIFFMVGTKFAELEGEIRLEVPAVRHSDSADSASGQRVVQVHRDGSIMMDQQRFTLTELVAELSRARRQSRDLAVLVRGDAEGTLQNVATVLAACREAGLGRVGIAVRNDEQRR